MVRQADQLKYPEQSWVISLNPSVSVQHDPVWHRSLMGPFRISNWYPSCHEANCSWCYHATTTSLLKETIETLIWNTQWFRWQLHAEYIYLYNIPRQDNFPWGVSQILKGSYTFWRRTCTYFNFTAKAIMAFLCKINVCKS